MARCLLRPILFGSATLAMALTGAACEEDPETAPATPGGGTPAGATAYCPDVAALPEAPASAGDGTSEAYGRLLNMDCEPLAGVRVQACTETVCLTYETGEDGTYFIGGLEQTPHKMRTLPRPFAPAMLWHADITEPGLHTASHDVVMPSPPTTDAAAWPTGSANTVTVAGGAVEVSADDLKYELGTTEDGMAIDAVQIPGAALAPYDMTPWSGKEDDTWAFLFTPYDLEAPNGATVTIKASGVAAGTIFDVYNADHSFGYLESVGTATANADGDIVLDGDARVVELILVVFVPQG